MFTSGLNPRSPRSVAAALSFALTALVVVCPQADAQDTPVVISDIELEDAGNNAEGVRMIVRTRSGATIPMERIAYKTKGNVVRVTFLGVPLAAEHGNYKPINVTTSKRVSKGYALKESPTQAFVRLRFDKSADLALKGNTVTPLEGGAVITFPFGHNASDLLVKTDTQAVPTIEEMAKEDEATLAELAIDDPSIVEEAAPPELVAAPAKTESPEPIAEAQEDKAPAVKEAEPAAEPVAAVVQKTKKPESLDKKVSDAAVSAEIPPSPIQLGKKEETTTLTRAVGALAVVLALVFVLAFILRKVTGANGGTLGLGLGLGKGVKILATYPVARKSRILVIDILGEVLVVSQGQDGALTRLHRLQPDRVAELEATGDIRSADGSSLIGSLVSKFRGQKPDDSGVILKPQNSDVVRISANRSHMGQDDELDRVAGTLDDLADSLTTNAKSGRIRRAEMNELRSGKLSKEDSDNVLQLIRSHRQRTGIGIETREDEEAGVLDETPLTFQQVMARREEEERRAASFKPQALGMQDTQTQPAVSRSQSLDVANVNVQNAEPKGATSTADDIAELTRQYRDRIRSLGRL